jgi:hypothetical protein
VRISGQWQMVRCWCIKNNERRRSRNQSGRIRGQRERIISNRACHKPSVRAGKGIGIVHHSTARLIPEVPVIFPESAYSHSLDPFPTTPGRTPNAGNAPGPGTGPGCGCGKTVGYSGNDGGGDRVCCCKLGVPCGCARGYRCD